MRSSFAIALTFLAIAFSTVFSAPAFSQGVSREIVTTDDSDYPGFDLRAEKDITLDECKQACIDDPQCKAFTFNSKVSWCFLKSDFRDSKAFEGAVAGKIVEAALEPDLGAPAGLDFLPRGAGDEARLFLRRALKAGGKADLAPTEDLIAGLRTAMITRNLLSAETSAAEALGSDPQNLVNWNIFTEMAMEYARSDADGSYRMRDHAISSAINAYLLTRTASTRAAALASLARAFQLRSDYRPALSAYKKSLGLQDAPAIASAFRELRVAQGFRVTGNTIDADNTSPRACVDFSENLVKSGVDYASFVTVDGKQGALAVEASRICAEGLEHGKSYTISLRAGLPSAVDESLEEPVVINAYIRDRAAAVRFTGENFVLPGAARQGIPVIGINADTANLELYRIGDRSIAALLTQSKFLTQLEGYTVETVRDEIGSPVWQGKLDLERQLNRETVTSLPLDQVLPARQPGIYVLTATIDNTDSDSWEPRATQWFLVSDIGISTYQGVDGLAVITRSLDSGKPLGEVELTLVARNNEVLGTAKSDAAGIARFEAGLLRGTAGQAASAVTARKKGDKGEDYVFLDLSRAGFDLSDRGVTGRAAPGPVDIFTYTDRGIYRLGETVHAMALARDDSATASEGLPLTLVFERPDGVEATRIVSTSPKAGGHLAQYELPANGMRGVWRLLTHTDPDGAPVSEKLFLVEDFTPDRIEFDLASNAKSLSSTSPAEVSVDGRFLYGAPANDLALEADFKLKTVRTLDGVPGYFFGLAEEEDTGSESRPIADLPRTSDDGKAVFEATLGVLPSTTRPLVADISVRMREDGGRAVERRLSLPVASETAMIGLKPDFGDGSVKENTDATFRIISLDASATRAEAKGLKWTLYRIERNYQWYRDGSYWRYESSEVPVVEKTGTVDVDAADPAAVSVPVTWGQYRFEVASADDAGPASSHAFEAGYYVDQQSASTPDALEIALDRQEYAPGETAKLRISPRFAGELLIAIGADRLLQTIEVSVPAEGSEIEIPVKAEWGAGAYVTATLFRPGSAQESRMPMRAIGTSWLQVSPEARKLAVSMVLPEKTRPGERLAIPVSLSGVAAGEEAFLTVAAVDVGILNLTRFEAPDPAGWYFGQRQLGIEIRDIYGNLIDGSLGNFGAVRTGGDGPALSSEGSPPTEKLMALFSGIVKVDAEGKALVEFDLPEFNGTARIMAVAWSKSSVGSAKADVIIRDPVVLTASLPKVLAPGDKAQAVLEIANADGPAGTYELAIAATGGLETGEFPASVDLAAGERKTLMLPVFAASPGTGQLTITAANGSTVLASRTQLVTIRPATLPVTNRIEIPMAANGSLTINAEVLAQYHLQGAQVSISLSRTPGFDVASLLTQLDRYPYGCAEQTISRALPLLYLSELDAPKELLETPDLKERIDGAVRRVLSYQAASGAFGLWGPDDRDMWLDAYVTDFLTRAQEKGYAVPQQSLRIAVGNLQNKLGYNDDIAAEGNAIAYSLYVLARNRMASAADLRYYADTKLAEFTSPLARAHIAAALSLYNEVERAQSAYRSALELASGAPYAGTSGYDYGSKLRDGAAMLALASETRPVPAQVPAMMEFMVNELASRKYTSTQEQAWMLLAARAAQEMNAQLKLTVNGQARSGALALTLTGEEAAANPVTIGNPNGEPLTAIVTTIASPLEPLAAGGDGFNISREYYALDGEIADITQAVQNQRYVVVLTVEETQTESSRVLVTDLLAGGMEIDNPRLVQSAELEAFSWLGEMDVAHSEFRADRFVAAFNRSGEDERSFSVAYVVRVVTPGEYALPAATVEDMYRPELTARTATGFMQVKAAQ